MDQFEEAKLIRNELQNFFAALKNARDNGLEYEFMEFFLSDYGNTKDVKSAIWYAECEWDL